MNTTKRRGLTALAAIAAGLTFAATPTAAHAEPYVGLEHDAVGSSHIASTDSTVALGPTVLSTNLDLADYSFTGSLPLPGTQTSFNLAGFLPVSAKVDFVEAAPVDGQISFVGDSTHVDAVATYYIKLSNIKIVGFPTITGSHCRTKNPVTIPVSTPADANFNILDGGPLVGEYAIGEFENCGLNTWLINAVIPGAGNTVDIAVSNGRTA